MTAQSAAEHRDILKKMQNFSQIVQDLTIQKQTDVKPVKLAEEAHERLQPQGHFTFTRITWPPLTIGPPKNLQKRPTAPSQAKSITEAPSRLASWQVHLQSTPKHGLCREAPICGSPTTLIRGQSPSSTRSSRLSPSHRRVYRSTSPVWHGKNLPGKGRVVSRVDIGMMNKHFNDARRSSVLKSRPDPGQIPSWAKCASPTIPFRPILQETRNR